MSERFTPVAAAVAALAAFACCGPLGLVSAFGILTASSLFAPMQRVAPRGSHTPSHDCRAATLVRSARLPGTRPSLQPVEAVADRFTALLDGSH
jgi:hypothetical protein